MNGKAVQPSLSRKFVEDYQTLYEQEETLRAQCAVYADPSFQSQLASGSQTSAQDAEELERLRDELNQSIAKSKDLETKYEGSRQREIHEKQRSSNLEVELRLARQTADADHTRLLQSQAELSSSQRQVTELHAQVARLRQELAEKSTTQVRDSTEGGKTRELETELKQLKVVNEGLRVELGRLRDKLKASLVASDPVLSEESSVVVGQLQMQIEDLKNQNHKLYGDKRRLEKLVKDMREGK